jgi:hypothetical protein
LYDTNTKTKTKKKSDEWNSFVVKDGSKTFFSVDKSSGVTNIDTLTIGGNLDAKKAITDLQTKVTNLEQQLATKSTEISMLTTKLNQIGLILTEKSNIEANKRAVANCGSKSAALSCENTMVNVELIGF